MSRKYQPKARSVDYIERNKDIQEISEPKVVSNINMDFNMQFIDKLTPQHLDMMANKNKPLQCKMTKTRSFINFKIGPESFISENKGKFSDYYKIISSIGQGGYGQVFKVQNRHSGMRRAMKSRLEAKLSDR